MDVVFFRAKPTIEPNKKSYNCAASSRAAAITAAVAAAVSAGEAAAVAVPFPVPAARVVVPLRPVAVRPAPRAPPRAAPAPRRAALAGPWLTCCGCSFSRARRSSTRVSRASVSNRNPVLLWQRVVAAPPQAQYKREGQTSSTRARARTHTNMPSLITP